MSVINLTKNIFNNCGNINSSIGALYIKDDNFDNRSNIFIINNNTFIKNTGNSSGAIFIKS